MSAFEIIPIRLAASNWLLGRLKELHAEVLQSVGMHEKLLGSTTFRADIKELEYGRDMLSIVAQILKGHIDCEATVDYLQ